MPLFEVDAERPVLVQPPAPTGTFGTAAQRVVDGNIDGLLGEQIFPVAQGRSADEPHLLALDAAGLPVVIEVVAELTEESLTQALNHAGRAGQLTRADLAARYSGGASRFQQDVAAFYDNVPLTRSQTTARTTGARLIIICTSAEPDVLDALDFLRQPGSQVAVLQLGVVHGADGRRFVDVSPLASGRRHTAAHPSLAGSADFAEGVAVGRALTGKLPVVTQHARPVAPEPDRSAVRDPLTVDPLTAPETLRGPDPLQGGTDLPAAPSAEGAVLSRSQRRRAVAREESTTYGTAPSSSIDTGPMAPIDIGTISVEPVPERPSYGGEYGSGYGTSYDAPSYETPAPALDEPLTEESPSRVTRASILTRESVRTRESIRTRESYLTHDYDPSPAPEPSYDPLSYRPPSDLSVPDLATPVAGQAVVPVPPPPAAPAAPIGADDDPDLIALAGSVGVPTPLVWSRPRRGQRFEATLYPDGFIELTDGGRYRHPDAAAIAVSGTQTADGWSVWRLGDDGPTLTDAFRSYFA